MFCTACGCIDAKNSTPPAGTTISLPFTCACSVPSFTMTISSFGCVCGGCEAVCGFSVLMCISSSSSVRVGCFTTSRRSPTSVFFATKSLQFQAVESSTLAGSSASETQAKVTVAAMAAATRSRRVIMEFLLGRRRSLPRGFLRLQYARPHTFGVHVGSKLEQITEKLLFASRWILAPIFLGLSLALIALGFKFFQEAWHVFSNLMAMAESD